jgi:prepilin-type N-terminal cleavage/methylation domain-containing protein
MYKKKGVTLVEVMVAIVIFTIVMVGGFVFFFFGRSYIAHSNHQRMALELTKEKIEMWKGSTYASIPSTQNESSISLGGVQFTRNTSAPETHDTDGSVYKQLTITTSWQERGSTYNVQLLTIIAQH